jgi:pimeloyl-ACP methyl ester carboxylesterase
MATSQRRSRFPSLAGLLRLRRETIAAHPRRYVKMLLVCLGVLLVVDAVVGWPFFVAQVQAVSVLDRVGDKPVPALVGWLANEPVKETELTLELPSGPVRARMYTPVKHPDAPGMVVVHGVHYLGMDEPRLEAFASAMAACGLRVLTPELPDIKDYHIGASSIASIGDTAAWMAHASGDKPVGVMGLSFSGSLSLLAAAEPQYKGDIRFVVAVGSEDEMSRVANYYLTGRALRPSGDVEVLAPHEYGALVLEYENLEDFVPKQDLAPLRAVLRAHLYEEADAEKEAMAKLNPQQQGEAKLLMDTSSNATRAMLAKDEAKHIQDMAGVSPHGHLSTLTTPVYLLHGEGDNIIPAAETQWMAQELPHQALQAELISPVLSHLDLDGHGPSAWDQWKLVHFFALILHAAEAR